MIKSLDNSSNGEKILYAKVLVWNQQLCSALAVYYSTLASGLAKLIEQQLGNYETVSVLATLTSITVSCAGFIFLRLSDAACCEIRFEKTFPFQKNCVRLWKLSRLKE